MKNDKNMNNNNNKNWLTIDYISQQENVVKNLTEKHWGKNRNGFCDIVLKGIELLIQGIGYLRNVDELNDYNDWNNFDHALRTYAFYHYFRISYTFKAAYNLIHEGYYTESAILMRHIVETFVRLKYLNLKNDIELINLAFAGHYGWKGKKFRATYETQFDLVAPGLYDYYRNLCDIAHGAHSSYVLKTKLNSQKIELDHGVVFKLKESSFIINQFGVYLLAHLEYMLIVYPEIKQKMPVNFSEKYYSVLAKLWSHMKEISEKEESKKWYSAIENLVKNKSSST